MKYHNILSALQNTVWPILPEKMDSICGFMELAAAGLHIDAETVDRVAARDKQRRVSVSAGSVVVLPVYGTISQRMDMMTNFSGGTSTDALGREFDRLIKDPDVTAIVMDVDSPGGNYYGTPELAQKIYDARDQKPVVAQVNSLAASAAYWIASAASEIVMSPSADAGSIGVLAVHYDMSAANEEAGVKPTYIFSGQYKVEANQDEPLSDEALSEIQRRVDNAGKVFTNSVARNRGVTPSTVRTQFGQGRIYGAQDAIDRSMADRQNTLDETISRLQSRKPRAKSPRPKSSVARRRMRLAGLA